MSKNLDLDEKFKIIYRDYVDIIQCYWRLRRGADPIKTDKIIMEIQEKYE